MSGQQARIELLVKKGCQLACGGEKANGPRDVLTGRSEAGL